MTDPYIILGVSPQSTDAEIKTAYRKLSQQYHPDRYTDSVMEEIATDKMAQINAAYDKIMNERRQKTGNFSQTSFTEIRNMISNGNYTAADKALDQNCNPESAEWNYLKGVVSLSRGWMNEAYSYMQKAVNINPNNNEYRAALSQLQQRMNGNMKGNPYKKSNSTFNSLDALCSLCECLICTDCLCHLC